MKTLNPAHLCALLSGSIWLAFWPAFLNYESYLYAAGVEGIINVADFYNVFQPDIKMPDFSRYHPNHPLPHAVVFGGWRLLGFLGVSVSALDLFRALNLVSSIGVVYVTYAIAYRLIQDKVAAVSFTLLLSFTSIRWFAAVNGETHMTGYFFLVLSFYLMVRDDNPSPEPPWLTLRKAVIFSLAFSFHFGMAVFSAVIAVYYVRRFLLTTDKRHLYSLLLFAFICLFFFLTFYGLLFRLILGVRSIGEWLRIFSMYSYIPMDGEIAVAGPLIRFFTSLKDGFFPGGGILAIGLTIALVAFVILGVVNLMHDLKRGTIGILLLTWILVPVLFVVVIMKAPNNMSYSSALLLPSFLVILLSMNSAFPAAAMRIIIAAWLVVTFTLSLYHVILPKFNMPENSAFLAKRMPAESIPKGEFYVLAHTYYGIIPDTYYLGHAYGLKPANMLFHYDGMLTEKFLGILSERQEFQLLTDRMTEREEKWCAENGITVNVIFHSEEAQDTKAYWFSTTPRKPIYGTYDRSLTLLTIRRAKI